MKKTPKSIHTHKTQIQTLYSKSNVLLWGNKPHWNVDGIDLAKLTVHAHQITHQLSPCWLSLCSDHINDMIWQKQTNKQFKSALIWFFKPCTHSFKLFHKEPEMTVINMRDIKFLYSIFFWTANNYQLITLIIYFIHLLFALRLLL